MEELQKLFDVLTRDGYYTKSFEEFKTQFGTTEYQDKVFDVVTRDGLFTQDKATFLNKYTVKKKDEFDLSVLEKDLVFGTAQKKASGLSDGLEVKNEEIPEKIPEEVTKEVSLQPDNVVVTEEEQKTTNNKKQFLISQNINIDALYKQARFGNPSTGQGGDFTGSEEEFVDGYYATYLVDKGNNKTQIDFDSKILKPKIEREASEDYETSVTEALLDKVQIDPDDYKAWEEETTRDEGKAFQWTKNLLTTDKTETFNKEQRDFEKIASYKASVLGKLNDDINLVNTKLELAKNPVDKLQLQNIKSQLESKYIEELQQLNNLANSFPTLKQYTTDRDVKRRKNIYDAAYSDDNVGEVTTEIGNVLKTIPVALGDFVMGSLAFITSGADQVLSGVGFNQKGLLAGLTERFLDGQESFEQFVDPVQRSGIIDGKAVTVSGKEYIVTNDGTVLDRKSHVRMNGIISDDLIKEVKERSKKVSNTETFFDGGGVISSGFTTLANLYGLIRGGKGLSKTLGVSPGVGMGLASYGSSMAGEVESMRADLMAAGLTEKEAMAKAIIAGNAIASLDGLFSGLAGGNQKVLSNLAGFKQQVINIVKKDGAKFSKDELKRKLKDLGIEMSRETLIEELPVLFSTKAVNAAVNYNIGREVRSAEVSQAEILETVILTLGATGTLGGRTLLSKNTRLDALRYVGMNVNDLQKTIDQLVKNGEITIQEGQNVYQEVYDMQAAELRTKGTITNSNNMLETSDLLQQRQQLISQREGLEGRLKEDVDKKIEDIDEQINEVVNRDKKETEDKLKIEKDAIQKQSPESVDDKKLTESSQKVDESLLDSESTTKSDPESKSKAKKKTQKEINSLKKKIEETKADSKINRPTKAARIKELNDKISELEAQAETETNIEEEVELTENEKLDRDTRLSEQEVKEAQRKEGYTSLDGDAEITVPILSKIFKGLKLNIDSKKNPNIAKAVNFINSYTKKAFQAAGNVPKSIFKAKEAKGDQYNALLFKAEKTATEFNRLFEKLKKSKKLDQKALEKLNEDLGKVLRGEMNAKDIVFKNKKGQAKEISDRLAQVVTNMRQDIDAMSKQILENSNLAKDGAKETIESQIGKYVTRSYRLFEGRVKGEKYKETLSEEVLEEARDFIKKDKGFIKEVESEAAKTNEKFEDALKRLVETRIDDLLADTSFGTDYLNRPTGGKNLKILKQRKEVPEPIRKLYGEITDPVANYLTTMTKVGSVLSSANFLQSVYENGIGKYIFSENDPNRPPGVKPIATKDNENYSPLDGLYTYPDIQNSLFPKKTSIIPRPEGQDTKSKLARGIYDFYMKVLVAYPRAAKTILSPSTQLINVLSNVNFAIANGHLPISIVNGELNFSSYVKAAKGIKAIWNNKSSEEQAKTLEEYYKLGIIDQNVDVRELQDLLNEADNERDMFERLSQEPSYRKNLVSFLWSKTGGKLYKKAAKSYRIGDDFWKIMGYEQESKNLSKVLFNKEVKDLNKNELKKVQEKAAEMVKNQYPNYSRIPALARFFKTFPLAGNFISFQAESYRTAYNTVGNAYNMIVEGNKLIKDKSDKAKGERLRKEGIRKIGNIMSYIGFRDGAFYTTATALGGKVLGGFLPLFGLGFKGEEPEEEEAQTFGQLSAKELAIRNFVYTWQKNQKLIITQAEDGKLKFTDASTFDPHQLLEANISVLLQSKNWKDALKGLAVEQVRTFASPDFVVQAYVDAVKKLESKGKAGEFTDDFLVPFVRRAILPGAVLQLEDAFGNGFLSGRDLTESKIGKLLGKRDYDIDVSRQLYFNLQPERESQMLAEKEYYNDVSNFIRKNQITDEGVDELIKLYEKTNEQKKESFLYAYEQIRAALYLGVDPKKIENTLRGRKINFSKKEINAIVQAAYIPLKEMPSKFRPDGKKKSQTEKDLGL
tara:strand:+ start:11901 stop:17630 length:5730 start_codon:yes stop_codon:yes gene_type:complete